MLKNQEFCPILWDFHGVYNGFTGVRYLERTQKNDYLEYVLCAALDNNLYA